MNYSSSTDAPHRKRGSEEASGEGQEGIEGAPPPHEEKVAEKKGCGEEEGAHMQEQARRAKERAGQERGRYDCEGEERAGHSTQGRIQLPLPYGGRGRRPVPPP